MRSPRPEDIALLEALAEITGGRGGMPGGRVELAAGAEPVPQEIRAALERINAWRPPVAEPQGTGVDPQKAKSRGAAEDSIVSPVWREVLRIGAAEFLNPHELARRVYMAPRTPLKHLLPSGITHDELVDVLGAAMRSRHGTLARHATRYQCHLCGLWYEVLGAHVKLHGLRPRDYEARFGVFASGPLLGRSVAEWEAERAQLLVEQRARRLRAFEEQERERAERRAREARRLERERENRERQRQRLAQDERRTQLEKRAAIQATRAREARRGAEPQTPEEWQALLEAHGYDDILSAVKSVVLRGGAHPQLAKELGVPTRLVDARVKEVRGH